MFDTIVILMEWVLYGIIYIMSNWEVALAIVLFISVSLGIVFVVSANDHHKNNEKFYLAEPKPRHSSLIDWLGYVIPIRRRLEIGDQEGVRRRWFQN